MNQRGKTMELVLFIASCVLVVVSGYLYLGKENNDFQKFIEEIKGMRGELSNKSVLTTEVINRLHERIDAVEVEIKKAPQPINITLPPVKVLIKQVPASTVNPQILKIKKQLKSL